MGAVGRAIGTFALTFVGGMLGPAGFAVYGSAIGSLAGGLIFGGPASVSGFRLPSLDVETSEYGVPINRIFGVMRTAGIIIDGRHVNGVPACIREAKTTEKKGGVLGFGGTDVTTYKYYQTSAHLWCEGPRIIDKLWYEDQKEKKLIFNRDGATDEQKGFVLTPVYDSYGRIVAELSDGLDLFHGYATQPQSSYLQSQHPDGVPSYVGKCYSLIKNLRFKNGQGKLIALVRDPENNNRREIIEQSLSDSLYPQSRIHLQGMDLPISAHSTGGGAILAGNDGVADFAQKIALLGLHDLGNVDGLLVNRSRVYPLYHQLQLDELGAQEWSSESNKSDELIKFQPVSVYELPSSIRINFQDINLNYQTNWVRSARETAEHENELVLELPIATTAQEMQWLCDTLLDEYYAGTMQMEIQLLPSRLNIAVGDVALVPDDGGEVAVYYPMRITEQSVSPDGVIACKGILYEGGVYGQSRPMPDVVLPEGAVSVVQAPYHAYFDIPALTDAMAETAGVLLATCGPTGTDFEGAVFVPALPTVETVSLEAESVLGEVVSGFTFTDGEFGGFDYDRIIRVKLENGTLSPSDENAVANSYANEIAIQTSIGAHVLRFVDAVLVSGTADTYDLTGILAGRYGTDFAKVIPTGAKCVLLRDADGVLSTGPVFLSLPDSLVGSSISYEMIASDDSQRSDGTHNLVCLGETLEPRSPVWMRVKEVGESSVTLEWNSRTRLEAGVSWALTRPSDPDNYEVKLIESSVVKLAKTVASSTEITFTNAELIAAYGSLPTELSGEIRQMGTRVGTGHELVFGPIGIE
jgi:hypothetical protein